MIELQYLATEYNKLLGTSDFLVFLNTNKIPDDSNPKTICTLLALRMPFAINDADAETINVTITCDLIASDTEIRDKRLAMIKGILGWVGFQIHTPDGEIYNCDSFLEQQPSGNPRIDSGVMIQQITITGTCLVSNAQTGALVSNRIQTFINDDEVKRVLGTPTIQKGTDDVFNLSDTTSLTELFTISRTNTVEYTILYRGLDIDKTFIKILEGETDEIDQLFTVKRIYPWNPDYTFTNTMKLTGGNIIHQAGAFLTYHIILQKVEEEEDADT